MVSVDRMTDDLDGIWTEVIVAYSRYYPRQFPRETEKNHEKPQSG
jgi:hypothetical protein